MLYEETMRRNDATRRDCARDDVTRGDKGTKLCERMILAGRMLHERMILCEGIMLLEGQSCARGWYTREGCYMLREGTKLCERVIGARRCYMRG